MWNYRLCLCSVVSWWHGLDPVWQGVYGLLALYVLYLVYTNHLRPRKSIRGQVAVVTGGALGIGRLIAHRLGKLGAVVVIWDLRQQDAEKVADEIRANGGKAHAFACDVSNRHSVYACAKRVKDEVGMVQILVNNAGIVAGKEFLSVSDEMLEKTMNVNATAHFWTVKAFLPDMIHYGVGHIVSVASTAGVCAAPPLLSEYAASKAAAAYFMDGLRREMFLKGHTHVRFTTVNPYFVDTGMFKGSYTRWYIRPIMNLLSPDLVAERNRFTRESVPMEYLGIVVGMLRNRENIVIPATLYSIPFFRLLGGTAQVDAITRFFGINDAMRSFSGRGEDYWKQRDRSGAAPASSPSPRKGRATSSRGGARSRSRTPKRR